MNIKALEYQYVIYYFLNLLSSEFYEHICLNVTTQMDTVSFEDKLQVYANFTALLFPY